jgi:hypothetical protein
MADSLYNGVKSLYKCSWYLESAVNRCWLTEPVCKSEVFKVNEIVRVMLCACFQTSPLY